MYKLHFFIFGALMLGTMVACQKQDVGLTDDAILESNKADILTYATSKGFSGTMTASGLYYVLNKPSSSTIAPVYGQEAEFNYKLYVLSRGSSSAAVTDQFVDSTYASKSSYIYIAQPGTNASSVDLNPGLIEGLLRMHEGDQATVLLPSVYGFGRAGAGNGVVPPNAPIRLDITLKRTRTEEQQIDEYLTANKLTPTQVTTSGLRFIKTLDNPTGIAPTPTQRLTMKYRGQLLRSASAFDSTGAGTYSAVVTQFVPGFSEGLSKLKVGEKATILFPSRIGYGPNGYQIIPPYAPLRFDIELVSAD